MTDKAWQNIREILERFKPDSPCKDNMTQFFVKYVGENPVIVAANPAYGTVEDFLRMWDGKKWIIPAATVGGGMKNEHH